MQPVNGRNSAISSIHDHPSTGRADLRSSSTTRTIQQYLTKEMKPRGARNLLDADVRERDEFRIGSVRDHFDNVRPCEVASKGQVCHIHACGRHEIPSDH